MLRRLVRSWCAVALLVVGALDAQQARLAPPPLLARLGVTSATVQDLVVPTGDIAGCALDVTIEGVRRRLALAAHELRSSGFVLYEQGPFGLVQHPRPSCVTFRGEVVGVPGARVAATIVAGSLEALIHFPSSGADDAGETWAVQPLSKLRLGAARGLHAVYRVGDTLPTGSFCGVTSSALPLGQASGAPDSSAICEIAVEADTPFYVLNGSSVAQTQNDITSILNQVDFIFDRDCSVTYSLTTVVVTTTNIYTATDANGLLIEFQSRWNSSFTSVQRDVAHLFSARNLTGTVYGLAYVSTVCNTGAAYGISKSNFSTNFNSRVALTCHELGHNFSAQHCNNSSSCSIMCSNIGGCSGNTTMFTPSSAGQISSYAFAAPCLPVQLTPPVIQSASPATVSVFLPGNVVLQGSGFYGATGYTVDGQSFTSGFAVSGDTSMSITMPSASALGPADVSVTTSLGASNLFAVDYVVTQPPKLTTTLWIPPTGGTAQVDFAGTPGNAWFLALGLTNATSPLQGFGVLANPVLLSFGVFSGPTGIEGLSVPVPPGIGYVTLFTQIVEGAAGGVVTGVSNFSLTIAQ